MREANRSERDETLADAFAERLGPAVDGEFREDGLEMVFHGMGGNAKAAGDDLVAHAFGDETEDFGLARREQRGSAGNRHANMQALGKCAHGRLDATDRGGTGQHAGDALIGGEGGVIGQDQDGNGGKVGGQAGALGQIEDKHVRRGIGRAVEHRLELSGAPGVGHEKGDAGALDFGGGAAGSDGGCWSAFAAPPLGQRRDPATPAPTTRAKEEKDEEADPTKAASVSKTWPA